MIDQSCSRTMSSPPRSVIEAAILDRLQTPAGIALILACRWPHRYPLAVDRATAADLMGLSIHQVHRAVSTGRIRMCPGLPGSIPLAEVVRLALADGWATEGNLRIDPALSGAH